MNNGITQVFFGEGYGKTSAALGMAVRAASNHSNAVIIQFLKGKQVLDDAFLEKLEPEIKVFRFEKSSCCFEGLSEEEKMEELKNIHNGLSFAKKVLTTGECDMLILDEVLGLVDQKIISMEDIKKLIEIKKEDLHLIMTGRYFPEDLYEFADNISKIETVGVDK